MLTASLVDYEMNGTWWGRLVYLMSFHALTPVQKGVGQRSFLNDRIWWPTGGVETWERTGTSVST